MGMRHYVLANEVADQKEDKTMRRFSKKAVGIAAGVAAGVAAVVTTVAVVAKNRSVAADDEEFDQEFDGFDSETESDETGVES